ncbi:hypothetical protein HK405_015115, partial [Cladochytrium tenue]
YFGGAGSSDVYRDQFTHVDFGSAGNAFLRACGVKDEPTPLELAQQLVRDPRAFLDQLGFAGYLQVLRTVAANFPSLARTPVAREMRDAPFLVGLRTEDAEQQRADAATADGEKIRYELAAAREISLIDDTVLNQLFSPLGAPMESLLEDMYAELGSQWLSRQVTELTTARGQARRSERAARLQQLIHERALLLLYDGQQVRGNKDVVRGAEQTLKSLEVVEVPEILIQRTFRGVTKSQPTTSCIKMDKGSRKYYLFITAQDGEVDYFDVAQALGKVIFVKARLNDSLLLSTLLSTTLTNLKRKGFPVDRILNLQEGKLKAAEAQAQAEKQAKRLAESQPGSAAGSSEQLAQAKSPSGAASGGPSSPGAWPTRKIEAKEDGGHPKGPQASTDAAAADGSINKQATAAALAADGSDDLFGTLNRFADSMRKSWIGDLFGQSPAEQQRQRPPPPPPRSDSVAVTGGRAEGSGTGGASTGSTAPGPGGVVKPVQHATPEYASELRRQLAQTVSLVQRA